MKRLLIVILTSITALWLSSAGAQTQFMYKYLDADGKTAYSNKPPPPGVKFEKIPVDTANTGVNLLPPSADTGKSAAEDFEVRARERKVKEAERDQLMAGLQQNLDAAVAALEAENEPREGERSQNANGTSRLNENYFNRLAELQKNVEDAKAKLEAARRE
jgi:hypothetical protein